MSSPVYEFGDIKAVKTAWSIKSLPENKLRTSARRCLKDRLLLLIFLDISIAFDPLKRMIAIAENPEGVD